MTRQLIFASAMLMGLGCAAHENAEAPTSKSPVKRVEPEPPEVPEVPEVNDPEPVPVDVVVSSAQMYQDCPDAEPKAGPRPSPPGAMGMRAIQPSEQRGDVAEPMPGSPNPDAVAYPPPCTQSTVQLSFASRAKGPVSFAVVGARMVPERSKKASLPLTTRAPSVWDTTKGYLRWDEVVPPGDSKASYKLGAKDWSLVERQVGTGTFYNLEVDFEIGGEARTVKSTIFTPAPIEELVT